MDYLKKLCIHTITTKPWTLQESLKQYTRAGIGGISIWQQAIEPYGIKEAALMLADHPIEVVSYVRGGFFPALESSRRQEAIDHNKKMIEEAAALQAPLLVLVCGAEPRQSLAASRNQIKDGIEALLPLCQELNVNLAIEPLHPMYADTRSAINTMEQANDLAEAIDAPEVGIAVDVYHLWWDPHLESEIKRCGKQGNLFAYHICDWKYPTEDMLNDRGLMGEGCINLKEISQWVHEAGFQGFEEVEIFSNHYWSMNQNQFLDQIIEAYSRMTTTE